MVWYRIKVSDSLRASSRAQGGGRGEGVGEGKERELAATSHEFECCHAAPNIPHGSLLAELSKFDQSATSQKWIYCKQICNKRFKTGILLRKTLHFLIDFVHRLPQKQENNSKGFNFIVSTFNVLNSKFVQPIDSEESNSDRNTNKTVARLVN